MDTIYEVITDDEHRNSEIVEKAVDILRNGGLVAFPTETVYGLGGDALNPESSKKIYEAKGRPSDNPLIVHIGSIDQIQYIAERMSEKARALSDKFWPGPLTMVLRRKPTVPLETTGGLETVAIRMPKHRVARHLLESGVYIAAPSANISGRPSPTKASYVYEDLDGKIDMIIEDDTVDIGLESTIIDMTRETPVLLRPGHISRDDIESVIGHIDIDETIAGVENYKKIEDGAKPLAPGMMYRHYAPNATLTLVDSDEKGSESVVEKIVQLCNSVDEYPLGILTTDENVPEYERRLKNINVSVVYCDDFIKSEVIGNNISVYVVSLGKREDISTIEHNLFRGLRLCNDIDAKSIYAETFEVNNRSLAVMNRLIKAAGDNTIKV